MYSIIQNLFLNTCHQLGNRGWWWSRGTSSMTGVCTRCSGTHGPLLAIAWRPGRGRTISALHLDRNYSRYPGSFNGDTDFQGVPQPQVPLPCSFPSYLCEKLPMLRMEGNDPMQTLLLTRGLSKQHRWKTIEANGNNSRVPKFHTFNTDSKHY